ncbi:MAG: hypothetical protein M1119_06435 [Firmicutes bacterium]|nr:hypothetical protein [Bacillota bacterium]
MELQLELLPYHYYNTLGFDVELIDYVNHVNDQIVLEKVKVLYKVGGRPPVDPRTYFRMHYLYFTRPELRPFENELPNLMIQKIRRGAISLGLRMVAKDVKTFF